MPFAVWHAGRMRVTKSENILWKMGHRYQNWQTSRKIVLWNTTLTFMKANQLQKLRLSVGLRRFLFYFIFNPF